MNAPGVPPLDRPVLIMAGGTGGHVFPALAVARELQARGREVAWLGTLRGLEARVVPEAGLALHTIDVTGLRGKGTAGWLLAPLRLVRAVWQAQQVVRRLRPGAALGMGGFASGPGGLAARLLGVPLVVHEQNAVAGLTNRVLARIATRALEAFPGSLPGARTVGNPVRAEIAALPAPAERFAGRDGALRLLVVGGSQGARALNTTLPEAIGRLSPDSRPEVLHQAGAAEADGVRAAYARAGVAARVEPFIADMAGAYGWADLVVCRSGALTVSELAAAGVGSVLVPFPHAVDDHQTRNAAWLVEAGAAELLPQSVLTPERLAETLQRLDDRPRLLAMAAAARSRATPAAAAAVADDIVEIGHG